MARGGYGDRKSAGRSRIVPFRRSESSRRRHSRRLEVNVAHQQVVRDFAARHGIDMSIKNDGQHWILVKDGNRLEWWPSSAKLVWNQRWMEGVHVHDYEQLKNQAREFFHVSDTLPEDPSESQNR